MVDITGMLRGGVPLQHCIATRNHVAMGSAKYGRAIRSTNLEWNIFLKSGANSV